MSVSSETKYVTWHETCTSKSRLYASVCNNKQRWINDKCRCECKELIDEGRFDKGFNWNPSTSECDKLCHIGKCLDYKNCKCKIELISKLVEEWTENIDGNEIIYNEILNDYGKVCNSCAMYIVLLVIDFSIVIDFGSLYIYFYWKLNKIILVLIVIILKH